MSASLSFCVVVRVCIRVHGCGELCAWQHNKVLKWCVILANHFCTTTTTHTHTHHYTVYPPTIAAARYIAAQGPKENTVHSYWQMAWENGTKIIIMLTQCVEGGRDKCYQ
jgi:acyl-coenzyme A synthetase/AMP-(fatty) acid ligase